ncbi:MAG: hypothetical protein HZC41_01840 [Chloroflexi bacterium]|nr:hypothetical protein [Chloroflexota bacterium]
MVKIVFFGDSLTQGTFGVSYVDKVAAAMPGHHFINEGMNGDTSLNLYRRVDEDVLAHQPDGVFVMVGVNDAVSFSEPVSRSYYRFVKRVPGGMVSPIAFRENMRALLGKLAAAQLRVWVALPPLEYRPEEVNMLRKMNAYAQHVCEELRIPVLDLFALLVPDTVPPRPPINHWVYLRNLRVLLGRRHYDELRDRDGFTYSFDGIHLTEQGAQAVADAIVPFLRANGVP